MRHILILGILCLTGCVNVSGPLLPRSSERPDDPRFGISEQESRGRARWALPDNANRVAPQSGFETQR